MDHDHIDHQSVASLLAPHASEEPVVSLYLATAANGGGGGGQDRRLALKNLVKSAEEAIRRDNGFDDERRKRAGSELEWARKAAEDVLGRGQARGSFAVFAWAGRTETFRVPVALRDRVVVDKTPFTTPLMAVLEQFERYGIVVIDQKRGRIFDYFLGVLEELEDVVDPSERKSHPAGWNGIEEARMNHHAQYTLHRHLQHVSERLLAHHKRRAFDKLILAGLGENVGKLERVLHRYLSQRIVAREHWAHDIAPDEVRKRTHLIEMRVELEKERALIARVKDHVCGDLLATTGFEETLRALYYGKVATLVVEEGGKARCGRECPECRFLMLRPQDAQDSSPVLVPCPLCQRATRTVSDVVDEAVELAILSGSKVEHISYAKDELNAQGGICSILRFR